MKKGFNQDFSGWAEPSVDLAAVRDGRRARVQDYVIDLGTAHSASAGTAITLELPGTLIYADADPFGGVCTVHIEDTGIGANDNAFYVQPGFTSRVPFTRLLIENTAQAGKFLRLHIGVDVDIQPGSNQQVNIAGTVIVEQRGVGYTGTFGSSAASVAATVQQLIAPAANTNGIDLYNLFIADYQSAIGGGWSVLAKSSAPASVYDGDVILTPSIISQGATMYPMGGNLIVPVRIAAGKGLYFWPVLATAAGALCQKSGVFEVL